MTNWNNEFWKKVEPYFEEESVNFDGVYILGYDETGSVILWNQGTVFTIEQRKLTAGYWYLLTHKMYEKDEFKNKWLEIVGAAHDKGIIHNSEIGSGIWKFGENFYIVNGNEIIIYTPFNGKFLVSTVPVIRSQIVKLNPAENWLDVERLISFNSRADALLELHNVFGQLYEFVRQWNFKISKMALYLTSFIILAPMSALMHWRPLVYLLGRRGVGKTTLLDLISNLWGPLIERLDKASPYSIAQTVGNTAKIPILDEFENDRHIEGILALLKNTTSENGGTVTRGTVSNHAKVYHLKQMFWLASIYEATYDAAIESRMAIFHLTPHSGSLKFPSIEKLKEMRHRMVSSVLFLWNEIVQYAQNYIRNKEKYHVQDGRLIDNYAYAAAVADIAGFEAGIPDYLENAHFEEDESAIMDAILSSRIRTPVFEGSVGVALEKEEDIEEFGLKKVTHGDKTYLAIKPNIVTRLLLKDTKWKDKDISAPLERIEGTKTSVGVKFNGRTLRAILVPWKFLGFE